MSDETIRPINVKFYFRNKRNKLINSALENRTKPITLQALESLKVNGLLPWETFTDNIGKIFPLILLMVSEGRSISYIEEFMGLRSTGLAKFIQSHPRLKKACNEARKVKSDRKALENIHIIEKEFILS